jgi:AhpC/TSA antioxidant enzyme
MNPIYEQLQTTLRQRVSDGTLQRILPSPGTKQLLLLLPQLGDFDSLEYAWWLNREQALLKDITVTAVAIGNLSAGQQFCQYSGFPETQLYLDPTAELHQQLGLYPGLTPKLPGLNPRQNAWVGLFLMCAGIKSPGTLKEVFRGYLGDRNAPQLIAPDETIQAAPLPAIQGKTFDRAGGSGFQRPFELATLRLRNMAESIGHWSTYVPDSTYLTQRGGTFLFDHNGELLYQHRDPGILGFSETMAQPLTFLKPDKTPQTPSRQTLSS